MAPARVWCVRVAGRSVERYDPYSQVKETDSLLLRGADASTAAAAAAAAAAAVGGSGGATANVEASSHGRYDVEGALGLESTLARCCVETLGESWTYLPARAMCGDDNGDGSNGGGSEGGRAGRGCVGPQDLEERIEVGFTRPTDGLGFCAAWCFFLAECRILNPDVPSAALVSRVVGQLARQPAEAWCELPQSEALAEFGEFDIARVYERGKAYACGIVSMPPPIIIPIIPMPVQSSLDAAAPLLLLGYCCASPQASNDLDASGYATGRTIRRQQQQQQQRWRWRRQQRPGPEGPGRGASASCERGGSGTSVATRGRCSCRAAGGHQIRSMRSWLDQIM